MSVGTELANGLPGMERFYSDLQGGAEPLDVALEVVKVVEADPNDKSVGLGGLPDRTGRVTLDACIMDHRGDCGSAAFLKRAVIVEDTRTSAHWKDLQHIVKEFGLLACWSIPIFDERQSVLGTLAISHSQTATPTSFQNEVLEMSSNVAHIEILL